LIDAIVFIHAVLARALLLFAVLLGIWGTYLYFRKSAVTGGFRSSFLILGGLIAVQGVAGLIVLAAGHRPTELLHMVYGVFAVLFIPGVYLYAHGGTPRREAVFLAGAAWIVSVAFFRGFATG
jgi:hypothetical protein